MTTRKLRQDEISIFENLLEVCPFRPYAHYRGLPPEKTLNYLKDLLEQSQLWGTFSGSTPEGVAAFRELAWDSEQLGFRVARIDSLVAAGPYEQAVETKEALLSGILSDPTTSGVQYVGCRVSADDVSGLHALELQRFVTVDGILTFSLDLSTWSQPEMVLDYEVRPAKKSEYDEIRSIGGSSFIYDRFHADPMIPKSSADRLKAAWVKNACSGIAADLVMVASKNGTVLGFVTCRVNRGAEQYLGLRIGSFDLVAVSPAARGMGVAYWISIAALAWFRENEVRFVEVGTQFRNHPSTAVYQKAGFKLVSSSVTLRKWIK